MILRKEGDRHSPDTPDPKQIKMPTGRKQPNINGGIYGIKQYGLGGMGHRVPRSRTEETWTDFARLNLYDKHTNGMTEGDIRKFIKRLGKAKRGGILTFEVLVHKKFIKYFPKNIPLDISPNGGSVYPDDAWYVKTYGNDDTRDKGRMMIDCGVPQGDGGHDEFEYNRHGASKAFTLEDMIGVLRFFNN